MHEFFSLMVPLQDIVWVLPQTGNPRIISRDHLLQNISLYDNLTGT